MTAKDLLECYSLIGVNQKPWLKDKRVLVTGACGSIGQVVCDVLHFERIQFRGVDNNEEAVSRSLYDIELGDFDSVEYGDVDLIFHCAAYKQRNEK